MISISNLSKEFGVSTRTLRYYEELGLLKPGRDEWGRRCYTRKDHAKLKLIFRGKRLGFTLVEIKEMIGLFDKDRTGIKQLEKAIEYGEHKIIEVNEQIRELEALREDTLQYLEEFKVRLLLLRGE
ncbi:MerR family transcriptional regulator [Heyndrickxia acidicola]|uniref:MerR family DNA-binding transcriptional regulator n=1 Tax=Heyndrickxia acidicola TaxID=209389 RepID=A0ABU6MCV6_9BACI|nr:MerR family DNA-binding transcriptional regulator [Heyndrickxia acidicola]MED1202269.1 MerR family DNA-binding transcriptional regulator [Heyndrickxia acidicola]